MTLLRIIPLILFAALQVGCRGTLAVDPSKAVECCAKLKVTALPVLNSGTPKRVDTADQSLVLNTVDGSSYAYVLAIESTDEARVLEVFTDLSSFWMPAATVFAPQVIFLNEALQVLDQRDPKMYQFHGREIDGKRPNIYQAVRVPPLTRYLVITTSARKLTSSPVRYFTDGGTASGAVLLQSYRRAMAPVPTRRFVEETAPQPEVPFSCCASFNVARQTTGEVVLRLSSSITTHNQ